MMKWEQRTPLIPYAKKDDILTKLMKIRGIENIKEFLNPPATVLNDPYILNNIEDAAIVIIKAITSGKKICISADPDSDGVMSTAIMYRYLIKQTDNVYIIYSERSKGHGIGNQIEQITEDTDLVIILDSSTNDYDAVKSITDKGMEVVILDHHAPEETYRDHDKAIIVNPQLDDYPNKEISGAAVVFKTIQVIDDSLGTGEVYDYIDLVACGIYADMMDVSVLENRYIIKRGMENIKNLGLKAILEVNKIDKVDSQTIGFKIAPLINGSARLENLGMAIQLMISDNYAECMSIVSEMILLNEDRRIKEQKLFEEYRKQVNEEDKVIIILHEEESKSFNGLVATKVAQEYKRPAIVARNHGGTIAGSYRSYGDFSMLNFMNKFKKLITYAVGHDGAGGVAFKTFHLDRLKKAIEKELDGFDFDPKIEYDIEIECKEISNELILDIGKFDYLTGKGFPASKFLVKNIFVDDNPKTMGKNNDTVKIICNNITVMKFKTDERWAEDVGFLDTIDVVGQLNLNVWTNWKKETTITNQVFADDYRIV